MTRAVIVDIDGTLIDSADRRRAGGAIDRDPADPLANFDASALK